MPLVFEWRGSASATDGSRGARDRCGKAVATGGADRSGLGAGSTATGTPHPARLRGADPQGARRGQRPQRLSRHPDPPIGWLRAGGGPGRCRRAPLPIPRGCRRRDDAQHDRHPSRALAHGSPPILMALLRSMRFVRPADAAAVPHRRRTPASTTGVNRFLQSAQTPGSPAVPGAARRPSAALGARPHRPALIAPAKARPRRCAGRQAFRHSSDPSVLAPSDGDRSRRTYQTRRQALLNNVTASAG